MLAALSRPDPLPLLDEGGPRAMLAPLVVLLTAQAGWRASLALGSASAGAAAPLLLGPR